MPSDITQAIEQDAIADTLVTPLHSTYEQEHDGADYLYADEGLEADEQEPAEELGPEESPEEGIEATEEQRAEFVQEMQAWQSLPAEQQAQRADEYLEQGYADAYSSIAPQEAENATNAIGEQLGIDNLSAIVDPIPFAVFSETWSDNVERTVALHPNGPAFLEALGNDPQQALKLAASMCDSTMVQRFFSHFQNLVGNPALFQGRDPLQFAAECILDVARLQGWGQAQRQGRSSGRRSNSPFQTNQDIFDNQALDRFATL